MGEESWRVKVRNAIVSPDAVQRHKRVYARLRRAMAVRR
jgi:hypothetical protein